MSPKFDLNNKVAVITGGSGVLGKSAALSLSSSGVKIIILSRDLNKAKNVADEINSSGGAATGFSCDILSKKSLIEVSKEIIKKYKKIDILLNTAGGNLKGATIGEDQNIFDLSITDFTKVNELNLQGSVIPSLVFGEIMSKNRSGVIINYSSMAGDTGMTRVVGYSAS